MYVPTAHPAGQTLIAIHENIDRYFRHVVCPKR